MLSNTTSCAELEYFIWWDHQVLWVLTVPVFGGSLDMLLSITLPDLISLLCFPVQPHSISPTVGNSDSYINLLSEHWQQRGGRERRRGRTGGMKAGETGMQRESKRRETYGAPCLCANALGISPHLQHGFNFVNQYKAGKNVDVKIHEAKASLKSGSLRGDLVHCLCLSTSDLGQVVLSGRQGWAGQRNNICYCSVALIRLINILHVSPAATDCVPSGLG